MTQPESPEQPRSVEDYGVTRTHVNQTPGPQGPSTSEETKAYAGWADKERAAPEAQVPGYVLLGRLGRGGMGVVYKAKDLRLDRIVALKMIRSGDQASADESARFRTEAQAAARLQHPNVVQIFEVGTVDGQPYLCLEYVDGDSLARQLNGTPWRGEDAAHLIETLARAIHAAHEQGVVHRDLKPANILLSGAGRGARGEGRERRQRQRADCCLLLCLFFSRPSPLSPRSPTSGWPNYWRSARGRRRAAPFWAPLAMPLRNRRAARGTWGRTRMCTHSGPFSTNC